MIDLWVSGCSDCGTDGPQIYGSTSQSFRQNYRIAELEGQAKRRQTRQHVLSLCGSTEIQDS